MTETDLAKIDSAEKALRGVDAPPNLREEAMDIIFATAGLVAEIRRLQGVIVDQWEAALLTEGQAAKLLNVDRLSAREIRDRHNARDDRP